MSIIANINKQGIAETPRFIAIENDNITYANDLVSEFGLGINTAGSDHFMSSFSDISNAAKEYCKMKSDSTLDNVYGKNRNKPNFYNWVASVLCAFIYGFDGNNHLHIEQVKFANKTPNGVQEIEQTAYLKIWKEKFSDGIKNHNDDPSKDRTENEYSLNILSFGSDYTDILGCFSNEYFVVPIKESSLSTFQKKDWKKTFDLICEHAENLTNPVEDGQTVLDTILNIRQRVLLKLSAKSISAIPGVSEPLQLIQAFIDRYVHIGTIHLGDVPSITKILGIEFYKIADTINLNDLFADILYLGIENGTYYATYPFTDNLIKGLKDQICSIQKLRLHVDKDPANPENSILGACVTFQYSSNFKFMPPETMENVEPVSIPFTIPNCKRVYSNSHIRSIRYLQTFCMYPNLPVHYQDECQRYTYFSHSDATILNKQINGNDLKSVDLRNGTFRADLDGTGVKRVIIDKNNDSPITAIDGNVSLYLKEATVPDHFIEVCDQMSNGCGYVMNMKLSNGQDVPALLENDASDADISFQSPAAPPNGQFFAYVDFGSSSSCMKYRRGVGGALLDKKIVQDTCTVQMLLAAYAKDYYKFLLNDPELNVFIKFPSVSIVYDETRGATNAQGDTDYYIYRTSWMPITEKFSEFAESGILTSPSQKTDLLDANGAASRSPNIIINNLCYTIACNAVINGCKDVMIVPSIPSSEYREKLSTIWDSAIATLANVFPHLRMHNCLKTPNAELLYESVAISNGTTGVAPGTLQINIDIGDGTTDMSAMIIDSTGLKSMCGYSSIEYAGKNLMKQTLRNILEHTSRTAAENIFKGSQAYGSRLLTPHNSTNQGIADYDIRINNLINSFFSGDMLRSEPDKNWENNIIDILSISNMKSGIDLKVAMDFITRYLILMPVVKDFVNTSIKIAGDKIQKNDTIRISFYGGSSKGIELLKVIDNRRQNAYTNLVAYFIEAFPDYQVQMVVEELNKGQNGKDALIGGLEKLQITLDPKDGSFTLNTAATVEPINWNAVNPTNVGSFGRPGNPHCTPENEKFAFVCNDNPPQDARTNIARINSSNSYYDNPQNPYEEFRTFFNDEIFGKLIDNNDNNPDAVEMLIKDFINKAERNGMKPAINAELLPGLPNNSFYRATHASIYPEMMKSAIYMFSISRLLSDYYGKLCETFKLTPESINRASNGFNFSDYVFGG